MFKHYLSLILLLVVSNIIQAQVWDDFTTTASLTYSGNNTSRWQVSTDTYRSSTGGVNAIDYVSTDMTVKIPAWDLNKTNTNEWTIWMSDTRTSVSGWGATNQYSFAFVLAANNSDFTIAGCQGYALMYRNTDDNLYLVRFSQGFTTNIETNSTNILSAITLHSTSAGTVSTNGKNLYVRLELDGKWTVKWLNGNKLTKTDASDPGKYTTGSLTSVSSDEIYTGTSYKYTGFVWNHSTSGTAYAYWDNLGFGMNGALPVELTSFTAKSQGTTVNLMWETKTEIDNNGFEVERNSNGSWQKIGFVEGHGTTNSPKYYNFTDKNITGNKIQYRLKQIDNAGTFEYSPVVEVELNPVQFALYQNYPNPFNPSTVIRYALPTAGMVTIDVFNALGEKVSTLLNGQVEAGYHEVSFDAAAFPSGLYFYKISAGDFTSVKKMLLMK